MMQLQRATHTVRPANVPCCVQRVASRHLLPCHTWPATAPAPACSRVCCQAAAEAPGPSSSSDGDREDFKRMAQQLNKLFCAQTMTGKELHTLIFKKWGRSYEARLHKRNGRMYLQVMWKFLEQQSFHMTAEQYMLQLDAVAELLTDWGAADMVRQAIAADKSRGPGYTGGTSARCVSIPLNIDRSGLRSGEWSS